MIQRLKIHVVRPGSEDCNILRCPNCNWGMPTLYTLDPNGFDGAMCKECFVEQIFQEYDLIPKNTPDLIEREVLIAEAFEILIELDKFFAFALKVTPNANFIAPREGILFDNLNATFRRAHNLLEVAESKKEAA